MMSYNISFNVKNVNEFTNELFINEFKEALKKVVAGKTGIRLEITETKTVFCIVCHYGETIWINRNKLKVSKLTGSSRNDYKQTTYKVLTTIQGMYEGWIEEAA